MKGKRLLAFVLAFIMAFPAAWGNNSLALETQAEEVQELRLENLRNEQEEITWIFSNEDAYTVSLNTEGLENITQVQWGITLYQDGEAVGIEGIEELGVPPEEIYLIDPENYSITLYGEGLSKITEYMRDGNQWFDLGVSVNYGEGESFEQWVGVFFATPEYQVTYLANQGDDEMLPNEDKYLPNMLEVFVWNQEHPYEEFFGCQITDMEIQGQYTWDENGEEILAEREFFWLNGDSKNGWNLHSDDHGFAVMKAYFTDMDEKEATHEFRVYSIGEVYYLELEFEDDTTNILTNSEKTVNTRLTKKYQDEHGNNRYDVAVEDYFLKIYSGYEQSLVMAEISEDGKQIQLKTTEEEAHVGFWVEACRMDNAEEIYLTGTNFDIWSLNEFYNIKPTSLDNPGIGETLDLSGLAVYGYNAEYPDGKKESADNVRLYVMDYDSNVWEQNEALAENSLPNFVRTGFDGGHIRIAADVLLEDEWQEVAQRYFWFDWLDYRVWLEDLQNGDHGWVYVDDEVTFHLNTENLADKKDYEVTFDLGLHQEETQEFIPFEMQEGLFETLTEDGNVTGITIKGSTMKAMEESLAEGGWFWVRVTVTVGEQEVYTEWRGIELREVELDYHYSEWGFGMLPHWDHGIGKEFGYYLRNAENPDGYDGQIQYTDIQVEIIEGEEDALVADEWEDGTGWNLHANSYGHAVVTLTHEDVLNPEETMEHSFDVWIGQDVWNISFSSSTGTSDICPGGTMDLTATIERHCYNEEDGHFEGATEPLYYEWGYIDGANQGIIDYETEGNVVHITAREDAPYHDGTGLYLRLYMLDESGNIMQDENGNNMEVCYADYWMDIREAYFQILPLEIDEPFELGEMVEITPTLRFINETENVEYMDNIVFEWEWNAEEIEITDSEGNVLTPNENGRSPYGTGTYTLKKLVSWDSNVWLRAYEEENGEYYEISYRGFHVKGIDYNSWFEKDRGEEWTTYLFEGDEAYQVTLNTDNLRDENGKLKENISIEWIVCVVDEEDNIIETAENGKEYTLSEDGTSIFLNGGLLKEKNFGTKGRASRIFVNVESNGINVQGHPYSLSFWVQEEYVELEHDYDSDTLLADIGGWYYTPEGMSAYVRNMMYPDGAHLMFEVRNIETNATDGADGEVFDIVHNEDGSWRILPLRCGEAQITYRIYNETLGEIFVTRDKAVRDELYRINIFSDAHTFGMLPNSELNLITEVIQFKSNGDGSWTEGYISEERYEVSYEYNQDLIGIDENGRVTSYGEFGETGVHVVAKVQMLNGQDYYDTNTNTQIWVTDYDLKIYGEDRTVNVDDTIHVSDLGIQMIETTVENPEGVAYEPEIIEIADMNWVQLSEDGESFTIIEAELGEEFPVSRRLHYKGVYNGVEFYDWLTININKKAPELKDEWRYDGIGWWYSYAQGGWPSNCWKQIDGQWYWFNASGYRTTGWLYSAGKWYYMNDKGVMATGWLQNGGNWYYMNSSGAMVTGWLQSGGSWYYMNSSGAMVTGWVQTGGSWYYMNSSGAMVTGWVQTGGSWYYMNGSGVMVTGWLKQGNTWYYFKSGGAMATGRIVIDGKMNAFSNSGAWLGYL